jgi:isoleucyl-tRNA synthetase
MLRRPLSAAPRALLHRAAPAAKAPPGDTNGSPGKVKTAKAAGAGKPKAAGLYDHTLLLPTTAFPMRADGTNREPRILQHAMAGVYAWQAQARAAQPAFVLHDGPPFANGRAHMGHALNKILKDITARFQLLQGRRVSFVPGWDCHGLPIEAKVLTQAKGEAAALRADPPRLRRRARELAEAAIAGQRDSFVRWGVLADWDNP